MFKGINLILNNTDPKLIDPERKNILWLHHFVNMSEVQNIKSKDSNEDTKDKLEDNNENSEDDEFNPTLAAMETEIKPKVLETINILTKDYNKLIKYQKEKLDCVLKSSAFSNSKEKNYGKM